MPNVTERTILFIIILLTSIAALFWIIAIAAPGWLSDNLFDYARPSTKALCIISLILLVLSIVLAAVILIGTIPNASLPLIFVASLVLSSIFILAAFGAVCSRSNFCSWGLMVVSLVFTYLSSLVAVFWLGTAQKTGGLKVISGSSVTVTY